MIVGSWQMADGNNSGSSVETKNGRPVVNAFSDCRTLPGKTMNQEVVSAN
jgi:hypothetical protein